MGYTLVANGCCFSPHIKKPSTSTDNEEQEVLAGAQLLFFLVPAQHFNSASDGDERLWVQDRDLAHFVAVAGGLRVFNLALVISLCKADWLYVDQESQSASGAEIDWARTDCASFSFIFFYYSVSVLFANICACKTLLEVRKLQIWKTHLQHEEAKQWIIWWTQGEEVGGGGVSILIQTYPLHTVSGCVFECGSSFPIIPPSFQYYFHTCFQFSHDWLNLIDAVDMPKIESAEML